MWDQRDGNIYPSYLILFQRKFKEKTHEILAQGTGFYSTLSYELAVFHMYILTLY